MEAMIEIHGNLWDWQGRAVLAITTNGTVNRRGECPMPRGCARQARDRYPELPARLGALIREGGNHVGELADGLVSFPVEHHWLDLPDPALIARSAAELAALADRRRWLHIVVPRPGCGGGGLSWTEVRPLLAPHFDDRFRVIAP